MKVLLMLMITIFVSWVSYATNNVTKNQSVAQKMLKPLIEQQCGSELKANKIWQASSFFWSTSKQDHAQKKICGCVSENALNDVSSKDVLMATINESAKNKLIQNAVVNSIKGCTQELLK
ncbi:hypothetical protein FW754_03200 [Acinetobacter sp. 1207_04]